MDKTADPDSAVQIRDPVPRSPVAEAGAAVAKVVAAEAVAPAAVVTVAEDVMETFKELPEEDQEVILDTLALDGRPAYHGDKQEGRVYHLLVGGREVDWEVAEGLCVVVGIGG